MKYESYYKFSKDLSILLNQDKYLEELDLLEKAKEYLSEEVFEKHEFDILRKKLFLYYENEMYEEYMNTLSYLVNEGYACSPVRFNKEKLVKNKKYAMKYAELNEKNNLLLNKAQKEAKLKYAVYLPKGYDKAKKYPIFLALHGDGSDGNIETFSEYWKPDVFLKHNIIFVYVQSSQVRCHNGYGWLANPSISKRDIKDCYDLVSHQYSIDEDHIMIGGFSGGAIISVDFTMSNILPIKGFISLCGGLKPESFTKENVLQAADNGLKGVFMQGEIGKPKKEEEEMIQVLEEYSIPYEFYRNKGVGHYPPDDLSNKLEQGLRFIIN